jgi:hypothetical protein
LDKFLNFFNDLKAGKFGYGALKDAVVDFNDTVASHADMGMIMDMIKSFATFIPYIMMAAMLLMAFFGKKLLPVTKFVSFFAIGFGLGVYFIQPLVEDIVSIPAWISGLVVGILAAIICRFLYVIFFAVAVFYGVYTACYAGLGETLANFAFDKALIFMAVAAVAVILAFILRRFVEMLYTSALGGYVLAGLIAANLYDYTTLSFLSGIEWVGTLVVTVVIALLGFVVQVKTRKRY